LGREDRVNFEEGCNKMDDYATANHPLIVDYNRVNLAARQSRVEADKVSNDLLKKKAEQIEEVLAKKGRMIKMFSSITDNIQLVFTLETMDLIKKAIVNQPLALASRKEKCAKRTSKAPIDQQAEILRQHQAPAVPALKYGINLVVNQPKHAPPNLPVYHNNKITHQPNQTASAKQTQEIVKKTNPVQGNVKHQAGHLWVN
jgi:hypothetical protein